MTSNQHNSISFENSWDYDCQDYIGNQTQNYNYPFPIKLNYLNITEYKIENDSYLDNKHLSEPLLDNFKYNKEQEESYNQIGLSTKEEKKIQEEILPQNSNKKKALFITENSSSIINKTKNDKNKINSNSNKKLGRKRRDHNSQEVSKHNKFSDDNLRRKCKHIILDCLMEFINEKIEKLYNGNIGYNIFIKQLKTLNSIQQSESNIDFNKKFLKKKLSEIFSEPISGRYSNFSPNHNKFLIEKLINEEDEIKKDYFKKLFDITFLQSINHFIGSDNCVELDGMKCFNEIKEQFDEIEYIKVLEFYFNNFEKILMYKKSRNSKKNLMKNL